jgi:hypothetical protein
MPRARWPRRAVRRERLAAPAGGQNCPDRAGAEIAAAASVEPGGPCRSGASDLTRSAQTLRVNAPLSLTFLRQRGSATAG